MLDTLNSAVLVLAQEGGAAAADEGGNFLVTPELGPDALDADRLRRDAVGPVEVRVPAHPGGARQAPEGDRGVDRRSPSARRPRPPKLLREYRERLQEARQQAEEIVARARRAAEEHERESLEAARRQREELLEQTRRDIEAETRRAIQEIRNEVADLTILATEKVTRKALTAGGPAAAGAGGARRARLHGARRAGRRGEVGRGGDRPGLLAVAVRRRQGARQARPHTRRAGRVRGRARAEPRAVGVLLLAVLLDRGEGGRAAARRRGRGPDARQLPRAADREAPHAGDLPHPAPVRRALGPRAQAAAGRGHERRRAGRHGRVEALEAAHPRADRSERASSRATWTRTSSAASCCGSATRSSTPRSGTAWSNSDEKWPRPPGVQGETCRSSQTRSRTSSRAASKGSTWPAPTSPRSAPCCRSRTASRACTASRTACRSRCSSSRTT